MAGEERTVEVNIGGYPAIVHRDKDGKVTIDVSKEFGPANVTHFDQWVRRAPHFIFIRED